MKFTYSRKNLTLATIDAKQMYIHCPGFFPEDTPPPIISGAMFLL
jgi:hypothetical protein